MKFDFENNSENYQSIIERMFRAKWIKGSLVKKDLLCPVFSEHGLNQMKKVCDALILAAPEFFYNEDNSTLTANLIDVPPRLLEPVVAQMKLIFEELEPPQFSEGERDSLLAYFYGIARRQATGGSESNEPPARS